jgi:hypothetical protein
MTVGYFKREQEKIRKRTDTDVAFTREYSRVSISTGNVKRTRRIWNVQGKGNYRVERGFRVFKVILSRRNLTLFYLLQSNSTFPTLKKDGEGSSQGKAAKKLYENTNPNVVDYKGLIELSPLGLPHLSRGLGANSGKL